MKTLNEESNGQQHLEVSQDLPILESSKTPTSDASTAESSAPAVKPKSTRKRIVDEKQKDTGNSVKPRRVGQRMARGEQLTETQDSTMPAAKPARAKRAQKQLDGHGSVQVEPTGRPKRAANRKEAKEADARTEAAGGNDDIPPVTASAIKYLGKKNATLADYIKLDPDSLTFVRYHLKRLHQLESDNRPIGEYADAKTQPVSPALQRLVDTRGKGPERGRGTVVTGDAASLAEMVNQGQMNTAVPSYGQKATDYPAYAAVVVQLRKLDLAAGKAGPDVRAGGVALDDNQRMHRVLGTAQILMGLPIRELAHVDAADLAASDIREVRAIEEVSARRLALNAMIESGLAQPLYHSEFAKQAPDLVEPAAQAYKAAKADWGLAHEAISNLSYLIDSGMSLTKDETAALARRTIATIRAIEVAQYREQALAVSHQAGLWYPQYRTEFAHNAPELVASAEMAYRVEEFRTTSGPQTVHMDENSIEQSPLVLLAKAQPVHHDDQTTAEPSSPSEDISKQPPASMAPDKPAIPSTGGHPSLGSRLLIAIKSAKSRLSTWLSEQRNEGAEAVGIMPMSPDKPPVTPVNADDKSSVVPESVAHRFLKVENDYYFQDRTPAFSDRGRKLATRGANVEVVRSMVEIAKVRGWDTITVKGTEEFRRSAWMEASQDGLTVVGYKPSALDLAVLANRPANNSIEKSVARSKDSVPMQPKAGRSSAQVGNVKTASAHQVTQVEPVPGTLRPDPELEAKAKAFEEGKPASVVRKYPDLSKAYGVVAAAKAFASEKLPESSRDEFIKMARRHMIEKIIAGEQIQGPKIYLEPSKTIGGGDQVKTASDAVDRGNPLGEKAGHQER
jgi:hypothetical protein